MPSSDLIQKGEEIIKQFDSFPLFTAETKAIFTNFTRDLYNKVAENLEEAEKNIIQLNIELKLLETEETKYKTDYIPEFNKAKRYLRESRQKLRKLADRTVKEVTSLKALLKDLDESKEMFLLDASLDKMKDLMIETLETLKEALETYNSAQETFQNMNSLIKQQNIMLKKMLDEDTAEYEAWRSKAEKRKIACIIADVFGLLGLCSGINHLVHRGTMEKYTKMLEMLEGTTSRMMKSGEDFDITIKNAMTIVNSEIELIDKWSNNAEIVKKNIDKYPKESLKKYNSIRTIFVTGLDDLQKSAEEFLARPVEIL